MIVHDKYANATDLEILSGFLSGKYMKRLQLKYGNISEDKHTTIILTIRHLLTLSYIPKMWYEDMYCLIIYATPEEINDCLCNKWKIKKWGSSLPNFISKYGKIQGNIQYSKFQSISSIRNTGNGHYQSAEHIAKKYNITIEDAISKKRTIRENAYKLRIERYGEEHKRICTPLSKAYYYNLGITDDEEIEKLRKPYLDAVSLSKSSYIQRYGKNDGEIKFNLLLQSRKNTIIQKVKNGDAPNKRVLKGNASKMSSIFFIDLLTILDKLGVVLCKEEIHLGIEGYKSEWWVRDSHNENIYYFIDFYIPKYKIAIEFDGVAFHCNDINNWPEKSPFLTKDNLYYYNKDMQKKKSIDAVSNLFISVRSDSYSTAEVANQILNHIKGKVYE